MNIRKLLGLGNGDDDLQREVEHSLSAMDNLARPRDHHYFFAHRFFPARTRQLGATTLFILADHDRAQDFLDTTWRDVAQDIPPDDRIAEPPHVARVGPSSTSPSTLIAIVEMPPAQAVTEAHFIALVCSDLPDFDEDAPEDTEEIRRRMRAAEVRYLTLEYGMSLDGRPRTAFCEWHQGTHLNRGDGPPPTPEDFWDFLEGQFDTPPLGSFTPPTQPKL